MHTHRTHTHTHNIHISGPQGQSRGFGFVHFDSPDVAKGAAAAMNGKPLEGKPLVVRVRSEQASHMPRPMGAGPPQHVSAAVPAWVRWCRQEVGQLRCAWGRLDVHAHVPC